jgi:predicted RNase H-like HicB family nuclease
MKTYLFKVVVEPDAEAWTAYCPVLLAQGASTWDKTRTEALKNLEDVLRMVVESLAEHGEPIPEGPPDQVRVPDEPHVAVTL